MKLLQLIAGLIVVTTIVLSSGIAEPKEPNQEKPMKYWCGLNGTAKEGQCGTMSDHGFVPDTIQISKKTYDQYVLEQPILIQVTPVISYIDVDTGITYRLQRISEAVP